MMILVPQLQSRNFEDFCSVSNLVLSHMIKWIAANHLVLNTDKTNIKKKCKNYEYNEIHNKEFITFYIMYWL